MNWFAVDLIVGLLLGVWMFRDAKKRKLKDPLSWLFIGVLLSVLGAVTYWYWIIKPNKKNA